jgi:hypothetical protein
MQRSLSGYGGMAYQLSIEPVNIGSMVTVDRNIAAPLMPDVLSPKTAVTSAQQKQDAAAVLSTANGENGPQPTTAEATPGVILFGVTAILAVLFIGIAGKHLR